MQQSSAFDIIEEEDKVVESALSPSKRAEPSRHAADANSALVKRFNMKNQQTNSSEDLELRPLSRNPEPMMSQQTINEV